MFEKEWIILRGYIRGAIEWIERLTASWSDRPASPTWTNDFDDESEVTSQTVYTDVPPEVAKQEKKRFRKIRNRDYSGASLSIIGDKVFINGVELTDPEELERVGVSISKVERNVDQTLQKMSADMDVTFTRMSANLNRSMRQMENGLDETFRQIDRMFADKRKK